ncbi:MAG: aldo/keto reductase, partial [Lachnospiraceae bacterium]|nr:aldo/keto reductase [Lachnospiraceae bacterium]
MVYKKFQDLNLSALGMGAMRLPTEGNVPGAPVDEAQVSEMVAYAMEHGINYFDTAYGYHEGKSEGVMGRVLGKYPRESYYLADKFPGYDLSNMGKVEEIFEEQLERTGMEYFDFYLFHNVCEMNVEQYLD